MDFRNSQIDHLQLPQIEEVIYQPLEQGYRTVLFIQNAIFFSILGVAFIILSIVSGFETMVFLGGLCGIILLGLISLLLVNKGFRAKGVALREKDVLYKTGWIVRKIVTVPFNRVQHCEVSQGIIEKQFGLSKLEIFTAGGSGSDLSVPGLVMDRSQSIRDFIMRKSDQDEEE